jgi:hypothetical protein
VHGFRQRIESYIAIDKTQIDNCGGVENDTAEGNFFSEFPALGRCDFTLGIWHEACNSPAEDKEVRGMLFLILLVVLLLALGGGFYGHSRWGSAAERVSEWEPIVFVVVLLYLMGGCTIKREREMATRRCLESIRNHITVGEAIGTLERAGYAARI